MLDRASTFANPEIIDFLQHKFVPVAIDQFNQRQQKDAEGDFWRKIAGQSPRRDFNDTTQGFYLASPEGELYAYNNNRGPKRIKRLMGEALKQHQPSKDTPLLEVPQPDPRFDKSPPPGASIIRVHAKVLGGYPAPTSLWRSILQEAVSRDNLWITAWERNALKKGNFPDSLARRIARFHLVDNTRGEPTFWRTDDVGELDIRLSADGKLSGTVHLERKNQSAGYRAELNGKLAFDEKSNLTRFDLVATGDYWGEGRWTRGAPEGRFPLGVSFRLTDGSTSFDQIAPQGTKGSRTYLDL